MTPRIVSPRLSRRLLLTGSSALAASLVGGIARPAISRAGDRPQLTHGVQSGDVSGDGGVVWARADRPSRMLVDIATTDSFKDIHTSLFMDALPESDFTAKALIEGLPASQDIFYRIRLQDLSEPTIIGEAKIGRFRSAPSDRRSISFVWSGDTAGQGWGIDESRGGMRAYATMLKHRPDFFIHSGDNIYADAPIPAEQKLPNGEMWKNVVTQEKSKPAETLAEYRGNYKYNLLDKNVLAFNADVPILTQWDDHEVTNNWWPQEPLTRAEHQRRKYAEKNALLLVARAGRAFHEYMPMRTFITEPGRVYRKISYGPLLDVFMLDMRSYRGPNGENLQDSYGPDAYFLGPQQIAWLKRELLASKATWKVIAADMPIGLVVVYDGDRKWGSEAIAQGDGPARGRELEIADILSFMKQNKITNTVWLTADVHYTAAHYYDPNKAVFQDFEPFWEFVSGPLHSGSFGPNDLDNTFGPQLAYIKAPSKEQGQNVAPSEGLQFFGHVAIEGDSGVMTVTLRDIDDNALWSTKLEPKRS
ncbi:alkaline phosphatase D family protein [Methylocella sp. CPCC 101449]|uniref:alkaline phosphatase D family protein n=1 Tax=Methylocella sp. CPCC 101449 TaxID=2987531 RepID=UPI00288CD17B|nr:alkaline phosphatase D family protein [Methylocella sp. CPCC 101449]MDT2020847.1 alkaline phosphatase D family protein [Methylocella sp. CPCC 101449]